MLSNTQICLRMILKRTKCEILRINTLNINRSVTTTNSIGNSNPNRVQIKYGLVSYIQSFREIINTFTSILSWLIICTCIQYKAYNLHIATATQTAHKIACSSVYCFISFQKVKINVLKYREYEIIANVKNQCTEIPYINYVIVVTQQYIYQFCSYH